MTDDRELYDRFEVEGWLGANRLNGELFVVGFRFVGDELRTYELSSERAIPTSNGVVGHTWIWVGKDDQSVITITSLEAPSRQVAHESLVRALSNFESPLVGRIDEAEVGDVLFGDDSMYWTVFARANLVFIIRNGGDELVDVGPTTRTVDELVTRRDDLAPGHEVSPMIEELGVLDATDRGRRLAVTVADPLERPVMLKVFSEGGAVERINDELFFVPTTSGGGELTVVGINPNGGTAMRHVSVEDQVEDQ